MDLDNATRRLQLSVNLVKEWGNTELPNGKTLNKMFTYDSISFWDLISVVIALSYVPKALSPSREPLPYWLKLTKTYLGGCKQSINDKKNIYLNKGKMPNPSLKPVFLFLGFQAYLYRDTLQPVVRRMIDDEDISVVSLCDDVSVQRAYERANEGGFQSIWQYWNDEVKTHACYLTSSLKKAIQELNDMRVMPRLIQNQGESLWFQMERVFDWFFIVYLPYLLKHYAIARHILEHCSPEAIISPDVADSRTRLYCLLGRNLQIPTLEVQFGAYGQEAVEWQSFVADRVAVWGKMSRDVLLSHGVEAEKIVLTGSPRHDSMVFIDKDEVAQTRARLGVPDGVEMILFASAYASVWDEMEFPELLDSIKRAIFKSVDKTNDIYLIVKPHPLEDEKDTKKLACGYKNIMFTDKKDDIKRFIRACDIFISLGTTATLDAIIANKLIICPKFPGWIWSDWFVNSGAVLVPKSTDELLQIVKMVENGARQKVLADLEPARQRILEQWVFRADGCAADRIKSLLLDMTKKL